MKQVLWMYKKLQWYKDLKTTYLLFIHKYILLSATKMQIHVIKLYKPIMLILFRATFKHLHAIGRVKEQWWELGQSFQMVSNIMKPSQSKGLKDFVTTSEKTWAFFLTMQSFSPKICSTLKPFKPLTLQASSTLSQHTSVRCPPRTCIISSLWVNWWSNGHICL